MKKSEPGCLIMILVYVVPVVAAIVFGISMDAISAGFFSLCIAGVLVFVVFSMFGNGLSNKAQVVVFFGSIVVTAAILFSAAISIFDIQVIEPKEEPKPKTISAAKSSIPQLSRLNLAKYYKENYPKTWGYIKKYADDPLDYVEFYDSVWGDLQEYMGDGIPFETLTKYEQSLVNYPKLWNTVFVASTSSNTYHSTADCYTLLRSSPLAKPYSKYKDKDPCSKCVGD